MLTNKQEMSTLLGINYLMSISKLPTTKIYGECGQFNGNAGIRNVMARTRIRYILRNLHFLNNI